MATPKVGIAETILSIITLLQDLAPGAVALVKSLTTKLVGASDADVDALTQSIDAVTIKEIDDELASKIPKLPAR